MTAMYRVVAGSIPLSSMMLAEMTSSSVCGNASSGYRVDVVGEGVADAPTKAGEATPAAYPAPSSTPAAVTAAMTARVRWRGGAASTGVCSTASSVGWADAAPTAGTSPGSGVGARRARASSSRAARRAISSGVAGVAVAP